MNDDEFHRQMDRLVLRESRIAFLLGAMFGSAVTFVARWLL